MAYKYIDRIKQMEELLDEGNQVVAEFYKAYSNYVKYQEKMNVLFDYYVNGNYQEDFKADSEGLIPKDLKRGVLDEDSVYDLIYDNKYIKEELLKKVEEIENE